MQILALDRAGLPRQWLWPDEAAHYYARNRVLKEAGEIAVTLHGGHNRELGALSVLECRSIITITDVGDGFRPDAGHVPYSRALLFARDKNVCCYCGQSYRPWKLEAEHVVPRGQRGRTVWTNMVTACHNCNQYKGCKTPEQAGLEMYYVPYAPNAFEARILENRNILADQMAFLASGVPSGSRVLN